MHCTVPACDCHQIYTVLNSATAGASDFDAAPLEAEAQGLVAFACAACTATTVSASTATTATTAAAGVKSATASWSALLPHLPVWCGNASAEALAAFAVWLLRCCAQDAATAAAAATTSASATEKSGELCCCVGAS
jgi:hypothetical protein